MTLEPAGPLDVVDALRAERAAFVALLRSLDGSEWARPTECPAYDVQGVAAHVLGDDFSLLSRQRDGAPNGLIRYFAAGTDFRSALNMFNDSWVDTVTFFGRPLLVDLLEVAGQWTADWYAAVPPDTPGEPVGFFGGGPAPYWQIAAREYVERWVHHQQIRRAVGRDDLDADEFLRPAAEAIFRGIAANLRGLDAPPGTAIGLAIEGLAGWGLVRDDSGWFLVDGSPGSTAAALRIARDRAAPLLSRGLSDDEGRAAFSLDGDQDLAERAVRGMVAMTRR